MRWPERTGSVNTSAETGSGSGSGAGAGCGAATAIGATAAPLRDVGYVPPPLEQYEARSERSLLLFGAAVLDTEDREPPLAQPLQKRVELAIRIGTFRTIEIDDEGGVGKEIGRLPQLLIERLVKGISRRPGGPENHRGEGPATDLKWLHGRDSRATPILCT